MMTTDEPQAVPGLRERQREARDEAILESAYALMEEHGYEAMTMDDLADRVGISKRTLYHHFPSKEAIAVRTVVVLVESAAKQIATIAAGEDSRARLEAVLRWLIGNKLSPPSGPFLYVKTQPILMTFVRSNPEFREALHRYLITFSHVIADAQADGHICADVDPVVAAQMIFGIVRGGEFDNVIAEGRLSLQELIDMLVGSILGGIMSKTSKPGGGNT